MDAPPAAAPLIRETAMPADANPYGGMFVGWIFGRLALAAGSAASQHSGRRCPVVAADDLHFEAPVAVGEELSVWADLAAEGRRSLTYDTVAFTRDRHGPVTRKVASGRFVLVAMDD